MYSSRFIPDRAKVTSGAFHTQSSAHSTGVRRVSAVSHMACIRGGASGRLRLPPRKGSMTIDEPIFQYAPMITP
nr:hypothetical protein [uncultured Desulfobacter sp.]